ALVWGKCELPIGRGVERVPADYYRAGFFGLVQPQQEVGEANYCPTGLAAFPTDRFWKAVIGTVGE
ncbi:MAG TPA: hypothetical protein VMF13_04615, partial [Luteitalea sp.]|nr:hypothetical protein [Luteitalea sp.]